MKKAFKFKRGSAIALALVFATVLLIMGLAYSQMTSSAKRQTVQIDERIKLEYLAQGLTEIAILKFQLFPADFYACSEAASYGYVEPLKNFAIQNCPEFTFTNDKSSNSTFNRNKDGTESTIDMQIATMTILTNNKWKQEVLLIKAIAGYTDLYGQTINKEVTRLLNLDRKSLKPVTP